MPTEATRVVVRRVELGVRPVRLRLPFRFGAITLRACPQLFVRAEVEVDGHAGHLGHAAEMMVPRWFDKRAARSAGDNVAQLGQAVERAASAYVGAAPASPFALFARHYSPLMRAGLDADATELTAAYGQAVLDRAVIDAAARARGQSFYTFAASNGFGLADDEVIADLQGFAWADWLPTLRPNHSVAVRHTVGLVDPLQPTGSSPDGLPNSLAGAIDNWGLRYFKIKLGGDPAADAVRLSEVLALLDAAAPGHRYSLDANEQYREVDALGDLSARIAALPAVRARPEAMLYVEQPLGRDESLAAPLPAGPAPWLLDEADGSLDSFPRAARSGWRGVSSKSCKGLYKALVNRARCQRWNEQARRDGQAPSYFISGEDLTCQAGLSLQQDLALVALLGLSHCERNGHYYGGGFATAPVAEQAAFAAAHPDLYADRPDATRLTINAGAIDFRSLDSPGFAHGADPDWDVMQPLAAATSML